MSNLLVLLASINQVGLCFTFLQNYHASCLSFPLHAIVHASVDHFICMFYSICCATRNSVRASDSLIIYHYEELSLQKGQMYVTAKDQIVCHCKWDQSLSLQNSLLIYHYKRDTWFVFVKGANDQSLQKGYIVCHCKMGKWCDCK